MKKLLALTVMTIILMGAGIAVADSLIWAKADPFPDEANGGYIVRFWSTDGSDRTQATPYVATVPGADTLEYNIDALLLLYNLEYSFQVWAYNGSQESDAGSNIVVYTKDAPSGYTPPVTDIPTHVQVVSPGPVTIQIFEE